MKSVLSNRKNIAKLLASIALVTSGAAIAEQASPSTLNSTEIKIFSLNAWHGGTKVTDGVNKIADSVIATDADIVALSETSSTYTIPEELLTSLSAKGHKDYTGFRVSGDVSLITRYPILSSGSVSSKGGSIMYYRLELPSGDPLTVCVAHLDYTSYALNLPRGYWGGKGNDGWGEINANNWYLTTDVAEIMKYDQNSKRDEALADFISFAKKLSDAGEDVVLAGDFNDASHLDWVDSTRNMYGHNGLVIPWTNSITLANNGWIDSYRELYPNPATHPGATWPSEAYGTGSTSWTPKSDERDRIDYIYYNQKTLQAVESAVVGSRNYYLKDKLNTMNSSDNFVGTDLKWPSDHKGVLTTFTLASAAADRPSSNAGANQSIADSDELPGEYVTLDGSGSSTPVGRIVKYEWLLNGVVIAEGVNPTVRLADGQHTITLRVTNELELSASSTVSIYVAAATNLLGGLQAYYPLDVNLEDASGNGRHGSSTRSLVYNRGPVGNAISFTNQNRYITLNGGSDIPVPWTASMWIKRNTATDWSKLLGSSSGSNYIFFENWEEPRSIGTGYKGEDDYLFGYVAPGNTWLHLTFVASNSSVDLYVDGSKVGSSIRPSGSIACPLGTIGGPDEESPLADLDEIAVWNRALSTDEIKELRAKGLAGQPLMIIDSDGDGIPDYWEIMHGLDPNDPTDGAGDLSGNGYSNLNEYLAGTDPNNPADFFRTEMRKTDNGSAIDISWFSVANRKYSILKSTNMVDWTTYAADISATPPENKATVETPANEAAGFYRVKVEMK
ncbi:LamG-like jellyroll fold domain-containing protein [Persicirhabdus sediminis]|uniref:Endonuclease/exonuclease/phosphatase family protein n=1 Tax=Persicirhabdus sediminis TaxID=454144 RepID=A0A8J7MG16_9BACT|nr:LamG-like jellyroll fold domain-containing protein [Persicirhabdus sediminis]MBK1792142.1 endonuclease/exonuclease/phosphatase family protein [Persicirhabdus sediminis]